MKTDIINPVSKKNIFFYNIFNKLIDSIKRFVGEIEEDTFGKWFTTEYDEDDNQLNIVPKLNDSSLNIGKDDIHIYFTSGHRGINLQYDDICSIYTSNSSIDINDNYIDLYSSRNDNSLILTIEPADIKINFNDENEYTFDETKIAKVYNCVSSTDVNTIVKLTQEEYDELEVKDENTLYVIIPIE